MSNLLNDFDAARQPVSGKALEELRAHYFIQASMSGSDDSSVGGLNINKSGRKITGADAKEKKNKIADDIMFMRMLEQKYGVDFAENWAAELLDDDTYKQLMQIEDQDERRIAIAKAIHEGIKNGTIDPATVEDIPDLKEWLDRSERELQNIAENTATNTEHDHILTSESTEEATFDNLLSDNNSDFSPS